MWSVQYFIIGLIPPSFETTKDILIILVTIIRTVSVQAQKSKSTEQTATFFVTIIRTCNSLFVFCLSISVYCPAVMKQNGDWLDDSYIIW